MEKMDKITKIMDYIIVLFMKYVIWLRFKCMIVSSVLAVLC